VDPFHTGTKFKAKKKTQASDVVPWKLCKSRVPSFLINWIYPLIKTQFLTWRFQSKEEKPGYLGLGEKRFVIPQRGFTSEWGWSWLWQKMGLTEEKFLKRHWHWKPGATSLCFLTGYALAQVWGAQWRWYLGSSWANPGDTQTHEEDERFIYMLTRDWTLVMIIRLHTETA